MNIEEFLKATVTDLATRSGIAKENLSRYLNGQSVSEKTLNRLGESLGMPSYKVLEGIVLRRNTKL